MAIRILRIDEFDAATFEVRRPKQRSLVLRFRYFIENSDWDDRILRHAKWVDGASLTIAAAAALYVLAVVVRIIG